MLDVVTETVAGLIDYDLREKRSATYNVKVTPYIERVPRLRLTTSITFTCEPSRSFELASVALDAVNDLREYVLNYDYITDVRMQQLRALEVKRHDNSYWSRGFVDAYVHGEDPRTLLQEASELHALNVFKLHTGVQRFFDMSHYALLILMPEVADAGRETQPHNVVPPEKAQGAKQ